MDNDNYSDSEEHFRPERVENGDSPPNRDCDYPSDDESSHQRVSVSSDDTDESLSTTTDLLAGLSMSSAEPASSGSRPSYELITEGGAPIWIAVDRGVDGPESFARGADPFDPDRKWYVDDGQMFWGEINKKLISYRYNELNDLFEYSQAYEVQKLTKVHSVQSVGTTVAIHSKIGTQNFCHFFVDTEPIATVKVLNRAKFAVRVSPTRIAIQDQLGVIYYALDNQGLIPRWNSADKSLTVKKEGFALADDGMLMVLVAETKRTRRARVLFVKPGDEQKEVPKSRELVSNGMVRGNSDLSLFAIMRNASLEIYSRNDLSLKCERSVLVKDLSEDGDEGCEWSTLRCAGERFVWLSKAMLRVFLWNGINGQLVQKRLESAASSVQIMPNNSILVIYRDGPSEVVDHTEFEEVDIPENRPQN